MPLSQLAIYEIGKLSKKGKNSSFPMDDNLQIGHYILW